jgi:hypothetical protein
MKRNVLRVRSAAADLETYPRSMPIGYAVNANPIAATLEKLFVGHRSGLSPVRESLRSQNQSKVRRSRVSRNAVCRVESLEGDSPVSLVTPVIDLHADAAIVAATRIRMRQRERAPMILRPIVTPDV